ncbi:DUF1349 domain-containing protein [Paenibacillus harenae]|uniref:Regulation of enolase protein 1 (Concanavalin A-like superfamily) n=1 Tax=Paenibacillus harenae TaxID=306543 RepID=A0ABT9U4H6_PAEHA|nr:DUF1349 domain-containing protein [Paenibacillus harenae]MDQ0114545.1 regulation of enolase protein 1 (concanavalin A-like superfamily) [Paenibacillus harenae]
MNLFEGCYEKTLSSNLHWINEPSHWTFQADGSLSVAAPAIADFFIDPSGETRKASAPYLYTLQKGDFSVVTRVGVEMKQQYDSGCLMIMADDRNWAKVCFEFFDDQPSILSVVTRNTSDDCVSSPVEVKQPYLRAARSGNCFAFHYSLDGEHWKLVRYFGMDCPEEIKVGVAAQAPISDGCQARFEQLAIAAASSGDIRTVTAGN